MRYTFVLRDTTCGHHAWADTCGLGWRFDGTCLDCAPLFHPPDVLPPDADRWVNEGTFTAWLFEVVMS